jgi:hypothetical protein
VLHNVFAWSVRATAGIPSALTRSHSDFSRIAPSSIEYCEWTWRWTKSGDVIGGERTYRIRAW